MTSYLHFNRNQWAALRNFVPIVPKKNEITRLIKAINKDLPLKEIAEIYLPLSYLLNFCYNVNLRQKNFLKNFLNAHKKRIPYIIGIGGSVAAGKSTTARILQVLLSCWAKHLKVELITTDGFLYSNQILQERGLMKKKGFPLSYDKHRLIQFISDIKSGASNIAIPIYSHLMYDIVPHKNTTITQPDILILEGLNVLQSKINYPSDQNQTFISDFVDFSIYIDAKEELLNSWYISRFMKLRAESFNDSDFYFYKYTQLSENTAINTATSLWNEINYINLKENILPARENAKLILIKSKNHVINQIRLRKK